MSGEEDWLHQEHSKHFMRQRWRSPRSGAGLRWPSAFLCQAQLAPACERGESPWEGNKDANFQQSFPAPEVCPPDKRKEWRGRGYSLLAIWEGHLERLPMGVHFLLAIQPEFIWLLDKPSDRGKRAHLGTCEAEIFTAKYCVQISKLSIFRELLLRGRLKDCHPH